MAITGWKEPHNCSGVRTANPFRCYDMAPKRRDGGREELCDLFHASVWGVGVLCLFSLAQPVAGQVRSFATIRQIRLEPPRARSEAAAYKELADYLDNRGLRRESPESPQMTARCTVHTDLPEPDSFGLECHDFADDVYVGTVRAKSVGKLKDALERYFSIFRYHAHAAAGTLPLNQYRFIYVRLTKNETKRVWASEYVADLLRRDGFWQVVKGLEDVPPSDRERVLACVVDPEPARANLISIQLSVSEGVSLSEGGRLVRHIFSKHGSELFIQMDSTIRRHLKNAVDQLVDERRTDERVHSPLPRTTALPN